MAGGAQAGREGRSVGPTLGWRSAVALTALVLLGAVAAATALADGHEPVRPPSTGVLTPKLIKEAAEAPDGSLEAPVNTDLHAAHRLPHNKLDRAEAADLLTSVFSEQVETPAGIFDEMPNAKFLGDHAAVMPVGAVAAAAPGEVEIAAGQADAPALVESSVPLRTEDHQGKQAPVDLSLERAKGELQPVNPIVETGIPAEIGEGLALANGDVELHFTGAAAERAPSKLQGDSAFYPNVRQGTDLTIAPTPQGVETMTQLRTAEAPTSQTVRLALPEGAELAETKEGGAEATLNGKQLLYVPPVSAIDAAGNEVPATLSVSGHDLRVKVSPGPGTAYPVLVDPSYIIASYNWTWGESPLLYSSAWSTGNSTPTGSYKALPYGYPSMSVRALDVTSGFPGGASPNQGAGWEYQVPRASSDREHYNGEWPKSWIEYVELGGSMFLLEGNSAPYPMAIVGTIDPIHNAWVTVKSRNGTEGEITGWGGVWQLPQYGNTDAKTFIFDMSAEEYEIQAKYRTVLAATTTIELRDNNTPTFKTLSAPGGWVNAGELPVNYAADDPGLGVYKLVLTPPAGGGSSMTYSVGCVGDAEHPCPRDYSGAAVKINAATAPEGRDQYKLAVFDPLYMTGSGGNDAVPHMSEEIVGVKVDHSPPAVSLSGSLTEESSLGTSKPQYTLKFSATDGAKEPATINATHGAEGSGNGQFRHPADLAFDPSEHLWVADQANNRIEKLESNGGFIAAYSALSETDHLKEPMGIDADPGGHIWVADTGNNRVVAFNSEGTWIHKVTSGFSSPQGIAVDQNSGHVWVADTGNNRLQEFDSGGHFIRAVGSKGSGNVQFNEPTALDVGPDGHIWVADTGNNRIEELNETGEFVASYGGLGSGSGKFNRPAGIDVDDKGNVYVLDENNGRVQQLSERGECLSQFGAKGTGSGQFTFAGAVGLTTAPAGEIWVADSGDTRIEEWNAPRGTRSGVRSLVVKMDGKEVQPPATVTCPQGGCPLSGQWNLQSGEHSAGEHSVEVAATDGVGLTKTEVLNVTLNPPAPSLTLSGSLTEQESLGTGLPHYTLKVNAQAEEGSGTNQPGSSTIATEVKVDGARVDLGEASCPTETCPLVRELTLNAGEYSAGAHTVRVWAIDRYGRLTSKKVKFTLNPPAPTITLSGTMTEQATLGTTLPRYVLKVDAAAEEGTGGSAPAYVSSVGAAGNGAGQFSHPAGIAIDSADHLWVADENNNRIEEFSSSGEFIESVGSSGSGNGQFSRPKSIAIDSKGDFWVADVGNSRLEEFSPSWEFLKAVGSSGSGNGQFNGPEGIAIDSAGNLWVADTYNYRVQELNESGEFIKVLSGLGAIEPTGLAEGPGGDMWIADWAHNRVVEVSQAGALLRSFGSEGTGNGQFKRPDVVAVDASGDVWVGDQNNERVQEFNQSGEYLAQFGLAGSGAGQFSFGYPMGIATDSKGDIWVSDTGNNRVQRWQLPTRSKVKTEITLDGEQVDSGEASCPAESCPISREWTLSASSELSGEHTVVVKATDGYGQWTSKTRTIEIRPDTTKPALSIGGELFNAPEGWVQQQGYRLNATATDAKGYGVTSILFKVDGSTIASAGQPCPEGACEAQISEGISMAPYSGGSHEAEVIATDGAGNSRTQHWTINVDPEGHVTTAEATATMEAVEETSESNLIGESEEEGIEGTVSGLGLEASESGYTATGSLAPMEVAPEPGAPITIEIPEAAELLSCTPEEVPLEEEPKEPSEEQLEAEVNEECANATPEVDGALVPVEVAPVSVSEEAAPIHLVEDNAAVSANTSGSVDTVVRPLSDGGMVFEAIRDESAPESYSYTVELGDDQFLRAIDDTHAEVYYSGHIPAFAITAEPAHDAVGTTVPTTLTVDNGNTVTLHVHYKAGNPGAPFVYPVVGGTGWEGGFRTIEGGLEVTGQAEGGEAVEELVVGAPKPATPQEAGIEDLAMIHRAEGATKRHYFRWIRCEKVWEIFDPGNGVGIGQRLGRSYCGNPFTRQKPSEDIAYNFGIAGYIFVSPGNFVSHAGVPSHGVECHKELFPEHFDFNGQYMVEPHYFIEPARKCVWWGKTAHGGGKLVYVGEHLSAFGEWNAGSGGPENWNITELGSAMYIYSNDSESGYRLERHKTLCIDC